MMRWYSQEVSELVHTVFKLHTINIEWRTVVIISYSQLRCPLTDVRLTLLMKFLLSIEQLVVHPFFRRE
jgi:hypothetical protein